MSPRCAESAALLIRLAKQSGIILLLVGHVTKEGSLAGPKVLEHMIDCSLMLEGSADTRFRTLRSHKNRFGAVNELGVFAMDRTGFKRSGPTHRQYFSSGGKNSLGQRGHGGVGGHSSPAVELQALVDDSSFGNPRAH